MRSRLQFLTGILWRRLDLAGDSAVKARLAKVLQRKRENGAACRKAAMKYPAGAASLERG